MNLELTREQKVAQRQLRAFRLIKDRLDSAIDMLAKADASRMSISSSIGAISMGGEQRDKMLRALVNMDEACDRIQELSSRFASEAEKVEQLVSDVQDADPLAGRMLRMVYINGMTPSEAAEADERSRSTVYVGIKRGLDIAYSIMGEDGVISWK